MFDGGGAFLSGLRSVLYTLKLFQVKLDGLVLVCLVGLQADQADQVTGVLRS